MQVTAASKKQCLSSQCHWWSCHSVTGTRAHGGKSRKPVAGRHGRIEDEGDDWVLGHWVRGGHRRDQGNRGAGGKGDSFSTSKA